MFKKSVNLRGLSKLKLLDGTSVWLALVRSNEDESLAISLNISGKLLDTTIERIETQA